MGPCTTATALALALALAQHRVRWPPPSHFFEVASPAPRLPILLEHPRVPISSHIRYRTLFLQTRPPVSTSHMTSVRISKERSGRPLHRSRFAKGHRLIARPESSTLRRSPMVVSSTSRPIDLCPVHVAVSSLHMRPRMSFNKPAARRHRATSSSNRLGRSSRAPVARRHRGARASVGRVPARLHPSVRRPCPHAPLHPPPLHQVSPAIPTPARQPRPHTSRCRRRLLVPSLLWSVHIRR